MTPPESTDQKVTAITVAPSTQSIVVGGTTQLKAMTAPTLGELTVGVTPMSGEYLVTVNPDPETGNALYYRVTEANGAPTIMYDQTVTTSEWTAFSAGQKIAGTKGQVISVVELTADGKARKFGKAVLPGLSA